MKGGYEMSIQRFEILNKVVQLQNITKAAAELNLSQSGISYAIKNLEEELDIQLLIRNRSGVTLTSEGERIYQHSLSVTNAYENLIQDAAAIKGIERGTIHIGTFASVTTNWMPKIITVFKERFPGITIKIYEDDYQSLENAVIAGELDCCFSTISNNKQLVYIPLKKDKLYCIVSNDCPLSKQKVMKISQIGDYPLIKPKVGWDNEISDFFSSHKINPAIAYEVSDDQSIIALVQANLGINIRPGLVLTKRTPKITVLNLEDDAYRMIGLATCNQVSHATQRFISVVTELFQEI